METLVSYKKIINMIEKYKGSMTLNKMIIEPKSISLKTVFEFASSVLTKYIELKDKINNKYSAETLNIKVSDLLTDYREIKDSKSLFKNKKIKNLIDLLNNELREYRTLDEEEFINDLKEIQEFQEMRKTLQKRNENFLESFGEAWKGRLTDLDNLRYLVNFIEKNNITELEKSKQNQINEILKLKISDYNKFKELKERLDSFEKNIDSLKNDYNIDELYLLTLSIEDLNNIANYWKKGINDLKTWAVLNENFIKLEKILQTNIKDNFIKLQSEFSIEKQLMKTLVEQFISYYFSTNETLDSFNGFDLKEKVKLLQEKVKEFNDLSIIDTKNQMSLNLETKRAKEIYENDFLSLQKAIRSKGRGQSIRTIFNQTANVIQDIFPVMLMSPLSTAQYIDPNFPKFDLIIFDEASQIPTDISVGAISRAKNCIVVGDPKQMPPTNFFGSNNIDENNIELEDLESLLDDCLAANFPEKHLKWHYRSNHESLIHFSNRTYYNSNLLTYPSSTKLDSQVSFKNINGIYRRGNGRINKEEANYIVNLLINHLKSESKDSIGVVTFNSQQQNLIENLLEEKLIENKDLDEKNINSKESIFVKNIENVQGDERDIIIFSTTFGPDEEGKMTMNFGPLNNEGGWRRLNVAVTRARKEMLVISSFEPEDIDLNRTKAEGVKSLKGFLEYARNYRILPPVNRNIVRESNSIITTLQNELEEKGYSSQINIGNSEFKIDIGILNPKNNNQFILGILIDGENYYNSKTSIDRNIIQPSMLKSLGWNIENIWSIDWYENKKQEIQKIINKLKKLEEEI
ncbi:AAA domain-containing protein [Staphylococcus sp. GDX8P47P]|nr:AAA domain-containing protein [Staphylococcus sp. GDX8P47P]